MANFSKVLIANRGEIAVRVIRAALDEGLATVAVYADQDQDSEHVRLAHESYALGGSSAHETYLAPEKILDGARTLGVDAIHPGYGFLSENAEFAQAVIDEGMVWIGPPPLAIKLLGDKVSARAIAGRVGAPLVPGTKQPVEDVAEVIEFARQEGMPIAVKAAYGGGGRGIKVIRHHEEIKDQYESAVREAVAAFGRGECFIERFLDSPRHVETQCLADTHGSVVVVSTRDCSLQRRNQKLVEEAPAPFLTPEQNHQLYESSKAILGEANYVGAGTCEFLVGQDGTISFLEVNTRLQVEHPVSEEVTGIDLVREQFRIARGEPLGYQDPPARGHSIEFRINGEDPGRGFMPTPGRLQTFVVPMGPGVRVDSGVRAGQEISGAFDSMLAKLIVTGTTRTHALQRARRALGEMRIEGIPTVVSFHQQMLTETAFAPELTGTTGGASHGQVQSADASSAKSAAELFAVHTRWIETEFKNTIPPFNARVTPVDTSVQRLGSGSTVEFHGRRVHVDSPTRLTGAIVSEDQTLASRVTDGQQAAGSEALTSPMQGTVVKVQSRNAAKVSAGDTIVVLEAMKMEQPICAHRAGVIRGLDLHPGSTVRAGEIIANIE